MNARVCRNPMMAAFLFALLSCSMPAAAQVFERGQMHFVDAASESLVSHAWAESYPDRLIRVLLVAPRATIRDGIELDSRLAMDLDTVDLGARNEIGSHAEGEYSDESASSEVLNELDAQLEAPHDVVILGNFDSALLPDATIALLIDSVKAGAGLIVAHYGEEAAGLLQEFLAGAEPSDASERITKGIGASLTVDWKDGLDFVWTATAGKGRIVELDYGGPPPATHCLLPPEDAPLLSQPQYQDAYFSLVAKAVRWAAGREPVFQISSVNYAGPEAPPENEIPPGLPAEYVQAMLDSMVRQPYQPYTVHFNQPADRDYEIRARVRQAGRDWPQMPYSLPIKRGARSHSLYVPIGPGPHFLDVWILHKGLVVDWFTEVVDVSSWPTFEEISYSRTWLRAHETLTISAALRPLYVSLATSDNAQIGETPTPTLYARAIDSVGRIVAENARPAEADGQTASIDLNFADLLAREVRVEVFAVDAGGNPINEILLQRSAYTYARFPVKPGPELPKFELLVHVQPPTEYNSRAFLNRLYELGVSQVYLPDDPVAAAYVWQSNLLPVFEVTNYVPQDVAEGVVRIPILRDGDYRESEAEKVRNAAARLHGGGQARYSLGKGNVIARNDENVCQSTDSIEVFAQTLEARYGSLETLNDAWHTSLGSWDELQAPPVEAAEALGLWGPWLSFRLFMDTEFTDIHAAARTAIRQQDPAALVGFEAALPRSPYQGYDWGSLARGLDFLAVPPDPVIVEQVRSYSPTAAAPALNVSQLGPVAPEQYARWLPWYALFHGFESLWWPTAWSESDSASPSIGLDELGEPGAEFQEVLDQMRVVDRGVGTLLLAGRRESGEIALFDSQPSRYLSQARGVFQTEVNGQIRRLIGMLEDLAYAYQIVDSTAIAEGALDDKKVLILPLAIAVDDRDIAAIRAFADRGGWIMADILPGEFDGAGLRRDTNPLEGLFGATRTRPAALNEPGDVGLRLLLNDIEIGATLKGVSPDGSVQATDGAPGGMIGDKPVWLTRGSGEGRAVLCNHPFLPYPDAQNDKGQRALVSGLLAAAGVSPIAHIEARKAEIYDGEAVAFSFGKARITALLRDPMAEDSGRAVLRLREPQHVYDMLNGEGLPVAGEQKITVQQAAGMPALFASLPYTVESLDLVVAADIEAGRRLEWVLGIKTKGETIGTHLIHVEFGPMGGPALRHYTRDVLCEGGACAGFIPLALNEAPGACRLLVRDTLSGVSTQALVSVKAKGQSITTVTK